MLSLADEVDPRDFDPWRKGETKRRAAPSWKNEGMSTTKGNAGEHLVMAELLARDFDAYWADRGNPAFDIACFWNKTGRSTRLRVKTTSNGAAVWTAKKSGLFKDVQPMDDLVVICNIKGGIRGADIFIAPTQVIEQHLIQNHDLYCSLPGKNGAERSAEASIRVLRFWGEQRADNPSYAYNTKFAEYRDAWDLLK